MAGRPGARCTLDALAMVVPAGTAGIDRTLQRWRGPAVGQIVLQHPEPGKKGNLGNNTIIGLGSWRFDANLSKTFRITESKSLAGSLRCTKRTEPSTARRTRACQSRAPLRSARLTTKSNTRLLQGQLRLSF